MAPASPVTSGYFKTAWPPQVPAADLSLTPIDREGLTHSRTVPGFGLSSDQVPDQVLSPGYLGHPRYSSTYLRSSRRAGLPLRQGKTGPRPPTSELAVDELPGNVHSKPDQGPGKDPDPEQRDQGFAIFAMVIVHHLTSSPRTTEPVRVPRTRIRSSWIHKRGEEQITPPPLGQ
jgi:hypothetical protein